MTFEDKVNTNVNMFNFSTLIEDYDKLEREEQKKKESQVRKKARKLRNMYANLLCKQQKENNIKELKQTIKSFNSFYKEFYAVFP